MVRSFVKTIANTVVYRSRGEFWKIVIFENDEGKPRAVAFVLSQAALIKTLPTEGFHDRAIRRVPG